MQEHFGTIAVVVACLAGVVGIGVGGRRHAAYSPSENPSQESVAREEPAAPATATGTAAAAATAATPATAFGGRGGQSSPTLRGGVIEVKGDLDPEIVHRIVRQNFGRFRLCYELGLKTNAELRGRVTTKFVIGRDGNVTSSQDHQSEMASSAVVRCVNGAFSNLSFPSPGKGTVTVVYPLVFSPRS